MIIKFPFLNGHIDTVKDILCELYECITTYYDTHDPLVSSNTEDSNCSSFGHHTTEIACCSVVHSHVSITKERVFKLNKDVLTPSKTNFIKKNLFSKEKVFWNKKVIQMWGSIL